MNRGAFGCIGFCSAFIGFTVGTIGQHMPAYTVGWRHAFTAVLLLSVAAFLGYLWGRDY